MDTPESNSGQRTGGAYVRDPDTGEIRRDDSVEQTLIHDPAPRRGGSAETETPAKTKPRKG